MDHLMIDIETLDTKPTAVVTQIAGVWFNPWTQETQEAFSFTLSAAEQEALGRTVGAATALWWMGQSEQARRTMTAGQLGTLDYFRALKIVRENVAGATCIWANGPDFDCVILANMLGGSWPFWKNRCVRTLKGMFPERTKSIEIDPQLAHDALEDCRHQIRQVRAVYQMLGKLAVGL